MVVKEYDFVSAWINDYAQIQGYDQDFAAFFTTNGLPANVLNNLSSPRRSQWHLFLFLLCREHGA